MGAELRDHRRPPPGLARVQADVQRTVDAGEVRLSESSPSATRFRRAGRGRVEVITFKPLSKNPGALHVCRVCGLSGSGTPGQPPLWQRRGRSHRGAVRTVRLLWIYERKIAVALSWGHCPVDEKLGDRPPRYWARARREPARHYAPICQDGRSGGFTELLARAEVSHDALIDESSPFLVETLRGS